MTIDKAAIMAAMEACFGADSRRIDHARKVTGYAEDLLRSEAGDYLTVIAVAILHDIGIPRAEQKYGSAAGKYQEIEGPPVARGILTALGAGHGMIDEVCQIIAHHHSPGKITSKNFAILYDADWLVNLRDEYDIRDGAKLNAIIDRVFLTESGKALARRVYLSGE